MKLRHVLTATILLSFMWGALAAHGQGRGARTLTRSPGRSAPQMPRRDRTAEPGADRYWAAQRDIEAAVQRLEAYLRESPDGAHAATARRQLAALMELSQAATLPRPVPIGRPALREVPEWRITAVDPQADKTRVTIEVACRRDDGGDCFFRPFDRSPLVLVDGAGRYHPMLEAGPLPEGVRRRDRNDDRVALSGGRTINVVVDFAPLAGGAVSGQVYYRDENRAQPARFSLVRWGRRDGRRAGGGAATANVRQDGVRRAPERAPPVRLRRGTADAGAPV